MKKSIIFFAAIFFVVAVFGQRTCLKSNFAPIPICTAVDEVQVFPFERQSHYIPQTKQGCWAIGETWFPSISNSSARTTVSAHSDGDMVNVWTFLNDVGVRGTGYNWYDKTNKSWDPMPAARLEDLETTEGSPGFPTHAFTENGEISVSHNAALSCLMVLTREKRGEGAWEQDTMSGAGYADGFFWPAITTSGNTVHMVAVYTSPTGTNCDSPLYFRSKDGGKTWDIKAYTFPEMPKGDREGNFADNYIIVSKGDHVVYAYVNLQGEIGRGNVGYMESKDGGDTWTHQPVLDCQYQTFEDFSFVGRTVTAAIGDEGDVHIAFSGYTVMNYGAEGIFYEPFSTAIVYWKSSTMGVLTPEYFEISENLIDTTVNKNYLNFPNVLYFPDLYGFNKFEFIGKIGTDYTTSMIQGNNGSGAMCAPRIVIDGNNVYVTYSSIIGQPLGVFDGDTKAFYRGVFLTVSNDNGDTFNQQENTSWISYHKELFFCDWSNYHGPIDPDDPTAGFNGTMSLKNFSENAFPTMALNLGKNQLLMQWANTFKAEPITNDNYNIYTMILDKSQAGVYNNTQEVWKGKWNDYNIGVKDITGGIQEMKIYPNPAQNMATVFVNSICSKSYTLTIANTMGQVILTQKGALGYGENNIQLNINNFASGVYLVNITTDNATRTQKLIVR